MKMQLWSVSTGDWQLPRTQVIVLRVMAALPNGMVVLFHDGGGYTRTEMVAAAGILIPELQAAGYRVAALPAQGIDHGSPLEAGIRDRGALTWRGPDAHDTRSNLPANNDLG
jgi:hypothetical protein